MAETVAIVGAGKVGKTLARGLRGKGYRIGPVVCRSTRKAKAAVRFIGQGTPLAGVGVAVAEAKIVLITVPDDDIAETGRALSGLRRSWRGVHVFHASGVHSSRELAALRRKGAQVGSLHPIYPLPQAVKEFPAGVVFGVEGSPQAVREAKRLVRALAGAAVPIRAREKALYHAAAVMVAGHLQTLLEVGTRMFARAGFTHAEARRALQPLVERTVEGFVARGGKAWTGPLPRGDVGTVRKHITALRGSPKVHGEVYRLLAKAGIEMYMKGKPGKARRLSRALRR